MKRIISLITYLLTAFASFTSFAQHKAAASTDDHSLLWRISGKGLTKPSYLFGTIHIICADDYVWTGKMKESLKASDKVCFEMNINDPNVMMQVAAGLIDKSGKTLKDYFTADQYKLLQQYIKDSIGMDIALLAQMKPVFLQTLMDTKKSVGCANPVSYEDSIAKDAGDKQVMGLETPDEQLKALESLPADSVIKDILDVIKGNNNNDGADKQEYDQLLAAYKQQDLPALYALIAKSADAGEDMGPLLNDRNKKWIARISDKMNSSSVFFAVGAGHLWGDNGVISLLKKNGYTVVPLK